MQLNAGNTYKYLDMVAKSDAGEFYNCKKALTYGRPWIFITGSRSIGKSTDVACFFIIDYIVNKHKFIYTRRTKDETLLTCKTFFGNAVAIINEKTPFNITAFEYDGGDYYIQLADGAKEQCGTIIPLSLEEKYKSGNYSEYHNLVYDEFISKSTSRYLGNANTPDAERIALNSLYKTIDRGIGKVFRNETRFFFLGNTATIYNPLFLTMGISDYIESDARFIAPKGKAWLLERVETVEALKDVETSFAYMLSDDAERDYAYHNKGQDENDCFIDKPDISFYVATLTLEKCDYGISRDSDYNYYIGQANHKITAVKRSLDIDGHTGVDLELITRWTQYPLLNILTDCYRHGRLFFNNGKTRAIWLKYLKFMP